MIQIHIEANSLHDLRKQLHELLDEPRPYVKADIPATLADEPSLPYFINAGPNRDALLRGEWEAPEQPANEAPVAQPEPVATSEPVPKMEDCRAALNALRAKHGPAAVRAILVSHGVNSFVDLSPNDYAKVIEEAQNHG